MILTCSFSLVSCGPLCDSVVIDQLARRFGRFQFFVVRGAAMPVLCTASRHCIRVEGGTVVGMASGAAGTAGSGRSSCHQEPVPCHLLAPLASLSVVSPSVMAPRGSGLLSYQRGSLRGLRAPLSGKIQQQSADQIGTCSSWTSQTGEWGFSLAKPG